MDVEKLIRRLRNDADAYRNGETLGRAFADQEDVLDNAATALSTLQAENEKLRAEVESLKKGYCAGCSIPAVKAEQIRDLTDAPKLRAELEQVKRERDAAKSTLAERIGVRGAEPITTAFGLPIDRLRELAQADREGRCVVQEFIPGGEVWVVERDEDGEATEVSCFVFVVSVSGVAIVSPSINGYSDLDFILYDFVAETAGSFSGDFSGYPISDCYKSYEEAEAALQGEQEEKR